MRQSWQPPSRWEFRPIFVLGGGILGRRIAACIMAAGRHVRIYDPSAKARDNTVDYVKSNIASFTALSEKQLGTCEGVESSTDAVEDC